MHVKIYNEEDCTDYFKSLLKEIDDEIKYKSEDEIINLDLEYLKEYFYETYKKFPLEIYLDHVNVEKLKSRKEMVYHERARSKVEIEVYVFKISIPYRGSKEMFRMRPSPQRAIVNERYYINGEDTGNIIAEFELYDRDQDRFSYEKTRKINAVQSNINYINRNIEQFNSGLKNQVEMIYNTHRERIIKDRQFFESLNVSINKNTEKIFTPPTIERRNLPEPKFDPKKQRYIQTPTLSGRLYEDILDIIYKFFKSVENKPSIFQQKSEEDLRDYVLPTLETRYMAATAGGETFNYKGKTDILIRYIDGSNLFIAELKFWKGIKSFLATIDQLYRYLSWRDSKAAIIVFVKNQSLTDIIDKVQKEIFSHEYFVRFVEIREETSLSYIFSFPNDKNKKIQLEVMFFAFND